MGNGVALLWFGSVIAHGTVLTLYLIQGTGIPSFAVALVLVPSALSRVVSSSVAARVFGRRGTRTIPAALLVQAVGIAALAAVGAGGVQGGGFLLAVAGIEVALGLASGLVEPPLRAVTLGFAPPGFHGVAASFLQLTQRLSATFCVAVASGLLFWGADAVMTSRSFAVSLVFCAVLLAVAAGSPARRGSMRWHPPSRLTGPRWSRSPRPASTMRDIGAQALASRVARLSSPASRGPVRSGPMHRGEPMVQRARPPADRRRRAGRRRLAPGRMA